jgi:transcriptional regulator with XRE-family HTH domain
MSKNELNLDEQRERLAKVFTYLKEHGNSQRDIADATDVDETFLSHLKSGKIKYIPDDFLNKLLTAYNISPRYIRLESEYILDITGTKLSNFEVFVDFWDVVEKGTDKYLHFSMDRNFYDFLLEVDKARLATDEGISSLDVEINNLKELYSGVPIPEEFVLIPRNNFIEIVQEAKEYHKKLNDVINLIEYSNYIKE